MEPVNCQPVSQATLTQGTDPADDAGGAAGELMPSKGPSNVAGIVVPGGSFLMGEPGPGDCRNTPEHTVTLSSFALDEHEVTVQRFRQFLALYDGTPPEVDAGANAAIPGSGWRAEWNVYLPASPAEFADEEHLKCDPEFQNWTDQPGTKEERPINCVSWYEAFAYCIFDNARLPTEAEWEYAAAGGDENRLYPWGTEDPEEYRDRNGGFFTTPHQSVVGSYPRGAARWGHLDLAGSVNEWTLDWYRRYDESADALVNPASLSGGVLRTNRASAGTYTSQTHHRYFANPETHFVGFGFRCARNLE